MDFRDSRLGTSSAVCAWAAVPLFCHLPVWKYAAASLVVGLGTAFIIRGTPFWSTPLVAEAALWAIIIISALFVTLYLGTVILLHWGCAPLRQFASLVREAA